MSNLCYHLSVYPSFGCLSCYAATLLHMERISEEILTRKLMISHSHRLNGTWRKNYQIIWVVVGISMLNTSYTLSARARHKNLIHKVTRPLFFSVRPAWYNGITLKQQHPPPKNWGHHEVSTRKKSWSFERRKKKQWIAPWVRPSEATQNLAETKHKHPNSC